MPFLAFFLSTGLQNIVCVFYHTSDPGLHFFRPENILSHQFHSMDSFCGGNFSTLWHTELQTLIRWKTILCACKWIGTKMKSLFMHGQRWTDFGFFCFCFGMSDNKTCTGMIASQDDFININDIIFCNPTCIICKPKVVQQILVQLEFATGIKWH